LASVVTSVPEPANLPVQRIVLMEADPAVRTNLEVLFTGNGYSVDLVSSWADCKKSLRIGVVSALLLDGHSAEARAPRLYEEIRTINRSIPVIVLGTSSSVVERVLSLELGADDYVAKPFDRRELLARVRAAIRRSYPQGPVVSSFGDVRVDFRKMEVTREGVPTFLTAQEFKVLKFMMQNSERVLSREELLNEVWGFHCYPTTRTVDNHILKLRQKLEPDPADPLYFLTVHSVGYKFVTRPEAQAFTTPVS
jgi:DNA-binding response OmpR family regulator